jgi:hypothetical protein
MSPLGDQSLLWSSRLLPALNQAVAVPLVKQQFPDLAPIRERNPHTGQGTLPL